MMNHAAVSVAAVDASPAPVAPVPSVPSVPWAVRALRSPAARVCFVVAMAMGIATIAWAATDYLADGLLHPFIREKRATGRTAWWLAALGAHVVAALVSFPLCLVLLSRRLLGAAPRLHRVIGRVTGLAVLLLLVPSGLVLSTTARGGLWGSAGFAVSAAIMAVAMVQAIATARPRDVAGHRRAVAHVIAQMSVAPVSRALLVLAAAAVPDADPDVVYVAALWLPVVGCAAVVPVVVPAAVPAAVPVAVPADRVVFALPLAGDRHEASRRAGLRRLQPVR